LVDVDGLMPRKRVLKNVETGQIRGPRYVVGAQEETTAIRLQIFKTWWKSLDEKGPIAMFCPIEEARLGVEFLEVGKDGCKRVELALACCQSCKDYRVQLMAKRVYPGLGWIFEDSICEGDEGGRKVKMKFGQAWWQRRNFKGHHSPQNLI
jgi:hypothetical protein